MQFYADDTPLHVPLKSLSNIKWAHICWFMRSQVLCLTELPAV